MSGTARVEVRTCRGDSVVLLGSTYASHSECDEIRNEIGRLRPASVGLAIDRTETKARFPLSWLKFQPPPMSQNLYNSWPGLKPFFSSLIHGLAFQHFSAYRTSRGDAYSSAVAAAAECEARVCTVGQQRSISAAQQKHVLPIWLRLMIAEASPAALYRSAFAGDRGALSSVAHAVLQRVTTHWEGVASEQDLAHLKETADICLRVYRSGVGSLEPAFLIDFHRRVGRAAVAARDASAKAPLPLLLHEREHEEEAAAVAFNIQEMPGSVRAVVLPHHLLLPVKAQLQQGVSLDAAHAAGQPPAGHRWWNTIVPTGIGAFLIGSCGAAIAGRQQSVRARMYLKMLALSISGVGLAVVPPLYEVLQLPRTIGQAAYLGAILQKHESILSAAALAYRSGSLNELAELYAAAPQMARSLEGAGSAADKQAVARIQASRERMLARESR